MTPIDPYDIETQLAQERFEREQALDRLREKWAADKRADEARQKAGLSTAEATVAGLAFILGPLIGANFGLPGAAIGFVVGCAIAYSIANKKTAGSYAPGVDYPPNWDEIRKQVLERDGHQCGNCGGKDTTLHVHHIVPLRSGGSNALTNLRTLCEECHKKIHPHMR